MEVFIEGGRSRDGRITLPRLGILSFVVDAFLDGGMHKARDLTQTLSWLLQCMSVRCAYVTNHGCQV